MKKLATLLALLNCLGSALAQEPLPQATGTIADTAIAARYMERSKIFFGQGRYGQAFEEAMKVRSLYQTWLGAESFEYANATYQVGTIRYLEGDFVSSRLFLNECLPILERMETEQGKDLMAKTCEVLGLSYQDSDSSRSIALLERALRIREDMFGRVHAQVALLQLNLGVCCHQMGLIEKAVFYYERGLETRKKVEGEAYRGDHTVYHNLGIINESKNNRIKAREYYLKSLNLRLEGKNLDEQAQSYLSLCYLESELGNSEQALRYGAEGLRICAQTTNKVREAQLRHAYGNAHHGKGDFRGAEENFEKSLELFRQELGNDALELTTVLNSIAITNASGPAHVQEYLLEALAICEKNKSTADVYATTCGNLAENYKALGDLDNAIKYARIALDALAPIAATKQHDIGTVWQNLGNYYAVKGDFAQSDHAYEQAEKAFRSICPASHQAITAVIRNRASAQIRQKNYTRAVPLLQETLSRLNQAGRDPRTLHGLFQDWASMEAEQENYAAAVAMADSAIAAASSRLGRYQEGLSEEYVWANVLKGQVCLRYYAQTEQRAILEEAKSAFQHADKVLQQCLNSAIRESDKSRMVHYAVAISEGMILAEAAMPDANQSTLFEISEQVKARALRAVFQETRARKLVGIPDSLLEQAHSLNVDIAFWEKTDHELEQVGTALTDPKRIEARQKGNEFRQRHDRLIRYFEKEYTDYHSLRYSTRTETVPSVQHDLLQPGQTLIEFFTGGRVIFIFVIRPDTYYVKQVPRDFPLEDWVRDMRSGVLDYLSEDLPATLGQYARAAHGLYQKLIAPVAAYIPAGDQIILIPDGVLTYIPFEALLTEPPPSDIMRYDRYPYWVLRHDISYCYSATLLREMLDRKHRTEPATVFLGMAPTYAGDTTAIKSSKRSADPFGNFEALEHNDDEVDSIQQVLGGQVYTGADATKKRFVAEASQYRIVHTALHGLANDQSGDYSFLAFYEGDSMLVEDNRLYVREIYNLPLNADLVTLSACETGIGELRRGEGIIGLARAFAYAGAKSIVGTLWNAHDKNTMLLMVDFYRRLKSGARKDAALAQAKRAFIRSGGERAHPFFWAPFVAVGDMSEVRG